MTTPDPQTMSAPCSSRDDDVIVVEMIGLPGAGKSTMYRPLFSALGELGQTSGSLVDLLMKIKTDKSFANYISHQEYSIEESRNDKDRFVLFSEGSLHEAWRMFYRGDLVDPDLLNRAAHLPDFVVYLVADCRKAKERIHTKKRRGPINRQLMDAPIPGYEWNRAANAMGSILEAIPPDRLLMIGNNADLAGAGLEEKAKQIAARISRELSHRPPNPAR